MKLATYDDGSRDGQLVVVSRDLALAHYATGVATRLQQALDDWNFLAPQLEDLSATLNHGKARHAFLFEPAKCMAPLPRAGQWAQALAYPSHTERLRAAGLWGEALPPAAPPRGRAAAGAGQPVWLQGASDGLRGPCDDAVFLADATGLDVAPGLAVVTGDIALGASPAQALEGVRLLALVAGWRLGSDTLGAGGARGLAPQPLAHFGPVAVTPDELGPAWQAGRAHLMLHTQCEGRNWGRGDAGDGMGWHFGQLLASLAQARPLRAGSLVGAAPVSHRDASLGAHCLTERWAIQQLDAAAAAASAATEPKAATAPTPASRRRPKPFSGLRWGDRVRIEALGSDGQSVFGAIEATVADRG